eukprot:2273474-Pleurochrysis_carterae.AAC.3
MRTPLRPTTTSSGGSVRPGRPAGGPSGCRLPRCHPIACRCRRLDSKASGAGDHDGVAGRPDAVIPSPYLSARAEGQARGERRHPGGMASSRSGVIPSQSPAAHTDPGARPPARPGITERGPHGVEYDGMSDPSAPPVWGTVVACTTDAHKRLGNRHRRHPIDCRARTRKPLEDDPSLNAPARGAHYPSALARAAR